MKNVFKVIDYEFNKLRRDYIAMLILIGGAVFYSFYYPFPYSNEIVREIPIAVVDEDKTDLSRQITRMLDETENIKVTTEYNSVLEAKQAFMERKVFGIIDIPHDFYNNVVLGNQPVVTLFADGSYMIFYSTALSASTQIVFTAAAGVKIKQMTMSGVPFYDVMNIQSAVSTVSHPLFNPQGGYDTFVIPAVYTVIIQQIFLIVISLLQGTSYEKGYNFPKGVAPVAILAGKLFFFLPLFALVSGYFFFAGALVYSLPVFGDFLNVSLFMIPYGVAVVSLAIAMGYFVREREGGMVFALMTSIPFLFISGFLWPSWIMPKWLQVVRAFVPSSPAIDGFVKVRQMGAEVADVMPDFINLCVLAVIYTVLAYFVIVWQMKNDRPHTD